MKLNDYFRCTLNTSRSTLRFLHYFGCTSNVLRVLRIYFEYFEYTSSTSDVLRVLRVFPKYKIGKCTPTSRSESPLDLALTEETFVVGTRGGTKNEPLLGNYRFHSLPAARKRENRKVVFKIFWF